MTLKVIGAGFGRTGTHSLAVALEKLGFGPCYHFLEIDKNPGHVELWNDALDGKAVDWDVLYRSYHSAVEWPTVSFLPQLLRKYPEAKVILTQRDAKDWYESANATIFDGLELSQFNPDPSKQASGAMKRRLILDGVFSGKYRDKAYAIEAYQQHIRTVVDLVLPGRLLQFRVTEGWKPLCDFLDVPMLNEPFPRRNDRDSMLSEMPDWARKIKDQRDS